jgi:hypothetical protein
VLLEEIADLEIKRSRARIAQAPLSKCYLC